jgi:hypothetical protein
LENEKKEKIKENLANERTIKSKWKIIKLKLKHLTTSWKKLEAKSKRRDINEKSFCLNAVNLCR